MLRLVCLVAALTLVSSSLDGQWAVFKHQYGRKYDEHEDSYRKAIFKSNLDRIEAHNERFAKGESSFYVGTNRFSDMTEEEVRRKMFGKTRLHVDVPENPEVVDVDDLPDTVDWRAKGYVTEVKDQGECGACWAFSTTGALEGQHFKATGKLVNLSESNLVDCSKPEGNFGCAGGYPYWAYDYIIKNKGIDTEAAYPYVPKDRNCSFTKAGIGATMTSYVNVSKGSESALQQAVATVGPVSIAIEVQWTFYHYWGGVYDDPWCDSSFLDHAILIVGYGTYQGKEYWMVKNSWGQDWGIKGYVMMARNKDNQCGVASAATYPIVFKF